MSDYASDLGAFVCCSPHGLEETERVLQLYFQREPTAQERAHYLSYIAISSFYWFVWALYKDACGAGGRVAVFVVSQRQSVRQGCARGC